ncbi:MAG TPA: hypothetical protein VNJ07_10480 [Chitinophagales bacterium]|nr:hypothetical protein [Chitinophagales bacterium]
MHEFFLEIIKYAYGTVGIFSLAAFYPTIKDLYFHKKPSANLHSYYLWTAATFITMLYSFFILDDFLFRLISSLNFAACFSTLMLIVGLGKK